MDFEREMKKLIAKDQINTKLITYCRSMDRMDDDLCEPIFAKDSYVDYGDAPNCYQGPGGAVFAAAMNMYHRNAVIWTSHQISNILIKIEDNLEKAYSESAIDYWLRMKPGYGSTISDIANEVNGEDSVVWVSRGRYFDEWILEDGEWVISKRTYAADEINHTVKDTTVANKPPLKPYRDKRDPSYLLFEGKFDEIFKPAE